MRPSSAVIMEIGMKIARQANINIILAFGIGRVRTNTLKQPKVVGRRDLGSSKLKKIFATMKKPRPAVAPRCFFFKHSQVFPNIENARHQN